MRMDREGRASPVRGILFYLLSVVVTELNPGKAAIKYFIFFK
jgi:hypothetical protein